MTREDALERLRGELLTIGAQLRAAYRSSGLTVALIAERAGVSETTLHDAMRDRNVTIGNVAAIAGALGLASLEIPSGTRRTFVCGGSGGGEIDNAPISPNGTAWCVDGSSPRGALEL